MSGDLVAALISSASTKAGSIEARIAQIEADLADSKRAIEKLDTKVNEEAKRLAASIDAERGSREIEDSKIKSLLQEAVAGGLYLEAIGVWWLLFGLFLSTASVELASIILGK